MVLVHGSLIVVIRIVGVVPGIIPARPVALASVVSLVVVVGCGVTPWIVVVSNRVVVAPSVIAPSVVTPSVVTPVVVIIIVVVVLVVAVGIEAEPNGIL